MPALFITLTANDSWIELKKILSEKKNIAAIFNPVEVCEFFFRKLNLIMRDITSGKGIFI